MIASDHGCTSIADALIHHGAKVNMVDDIQHWTALNHTKDEGTIQLLQEHGGLYGQDIGSQDTPLDKSQDAPSDLQDMPTNESKDTPITSRYKIPFTFLFHTIRELGHLIRPKQRQNIHSNINQEPNQPIQES